jgi:hypothetical protein
MDYFIITQNRVYFVKTMGFKNKKDLICISYACSFLIEILYENNSQLYEIIIII